VNGNTRVSRLDVLFHALQAIRSPSNQYQIATFLRKLVGARCPNTSCGAGDQNHFAL
jgi:hypothetical protein